MIISAGDDPVVRVWDAGDATQFAALEGHTITVYAVALAGLNGRSIAICAGNDPRLRLWDLSTQSELSTLEGHTGIVRGIATAEMSGRSKVASASVDKTVRVWDLGDSTQVVLEGSTSYAVAAGKIDDLPVIVSGEYEMVRVWDPQTGETRLGRGHIGEVQAVAVGRVEGHPIIVSGGVDETIRVWDLHTDSVEVIEVRAPVNDVALTEDGTLAVATDRGILALQLLCPPADGR